MYQSKTTSFVKASAALIATLIIAATGVAFFMQKDSNAAPVSDFKPGRIIEDSVFTNSVSMNPQQIQSFLNAKVPTCDTNGTQRSEMDNRGVPDYNGNGSIQRWEWGRAKYNQTTFPCLKDYTENGRVAAQIIYDVSQTFAINPQVLIVLLQKEQSLVTDTWPSVIQYRSATGYGCPDTAACDSQYYGLTNQLTWAARMFRSILNNSPGWYTPYNLGNNFIRWSPISSCGGSTVNIENRSTQALYNYTPYQPNASALAAGYGMGDGCGAYGNRNFYLYFRDWFGYNAGPAAFKTADSATVYVPVEGYKMAAPSMALLNDYGISSSSIQVVSQQYVDARPTAPSNTGISSSIAYMVKSPNDTDEDGGSVYLISRGKRYQVQSMQQFFNFGFQENQISFLPLGYIFSLPTGGLLQNYITSPSSEVFRVDTSGKHLFFDYPTYIKNNPSDQVSAFSYNLIDGLTSGDPVTDGPVLVKYLNSSAVYLYQNGTYYLAPDYTTFSQCWGLDNHLNMVINSPTQDNYIKQINSSNQLSCQINDGVNNVVLNGNTKYIIPATSGISSQSVSSDLRALASKIPTRQNSLSAYVKTADNPSVWFIDSGKRYLIPSYNNLIALGAKDSDIDTINSNTLYSLTNGGIKLGNGTLVKSDSSGAVYVVKNNERLLFPSSELFNSYGASWSEIESYSESSLNSRYPFLSKSLSEYITNPTTGKTYLVAQNACFEITAQLYDALGVNYNQLNTSYSYGDTLFQNKLRTCSAGTRFIKAPNSSLVYYLNNGTKQGINSYATMVSLNGGASPIIMTLSPQFLNTVPTGSSL